MPDLNADNIANIISGLAFLLSCYGVCHSRSLETKSEAQEKQNKLFEIETKLDYILSNCQEYNKFVAYKVKNLQDDLLIFCKKYKVDSEQMFRLFAKIYLPISNDGEDIEYSFDEISNNSSRLLKFLKNA